jgi:hypothetical protein
VVNEWRHAGESQAASAQPSGSTVAFMTWSQRAQYVHGKHVVELEDWQRGNPVIVPTGAKSGQPRIDSHADLRQAEYYQGVFDVLRATVNEELTHHRALLALHSANGDVSAVSRLQRIIRVKEAELAEIDHVTDALSCRFPTSQVGDDSPFRTGHSPR